MLTALCGMIQDITMPTVETETISRNWSVRFKILLDCRVYIISVKMRATFLEMLKLNLWR